MSIETVITLLVVVYTLVPVVFACYLAWTNSGEVLELDAELHARFMEYEQWTM